MLNYRKIVQEIEARGVMPDTAPSLVPMQKTLERLFPKSIRSQDHLELHARGYFKPEKTIVVAGTNGKGSVCATLEALLLAAGKTVGLYTSPHLEETTERIRINGQQVSQEVFCEAYRAISNATQDIRLTHFEILTAMGAWLFFSKTSEVEYAIFEVGLGGTWDATNAIPHHHCIITSLGYDHQNLLGNTIEEIAANKFGIVQKGAQVVYSPFPKTSESSLKNLALTVASTTQSHWLESPPFQLEVQSEPKYPGAREVPKFTLKTAWGTAPISLPGQRSAQNITTALAAFQQLGFNPGSYLSALNQIQWPGRMEEITGAQPCPTYLSGDHNPQGAASLVELLKYYKRRHLYILAGIGQDKDLDGILSQFFSLSEASVYLTETPFKGRSIENYGHWTNLASDRSKDAVALLRKIQKLAQPDDMIVITGSLYLVGQLRSQIQSQSDT